MPNPPDDPEPPANATHRAVVEVLGSGRPLWWKAERVVALLCGYELIAGQRQDAGDDRPFDLRSPDDRIRIDVKTQRSNQLDVKKEKPGKQFTAWAATGRRFVPLQLVLDSLSGGWYVVPGVPRRTAQVVLDPTVTRHNTPSPTSPFWVGRCSLEELRQLERCEAMSIDLKESLEFVERNREPIQASVEEEERAYIASTAEVTLEHPGLMAAVLEKIGQSPEAMDKLAKSKEAMSQLAQSDAYIASTAEVTLEHPGLMAAVLEKVGQSPEAMDKLARSDEALANLSKAIQQDPAQLAKLLALLGVSRPTDDAS